MRVDQRPFLAVEPLADIEDGQVLVGAATAVEVASATLVRQPVALQHHELAAADVAGRARAVGTLVENGVDRERALTLVGWGGA